MLRSQNTCTHPVEHRFRYQVLGKDAVVGCRDCGAEIPSAEEILETWKTRKQPWFNSVHCPICGARVIVLRYARVTGPIERLLALAGHVKAVHPEECGKKG